MVVAECNPLKIHLRYPEKNKDGEKFIVTVNHFTSEEMQEHDARNGNVYFSQHRYQTVLNALNNMNDNDSLRFAINILSGKYGSYANIKRN